MIVTLLAHCRPKVGLTLHAPDELPFQLRDYENVHVVNLPSLT